MEGAEAQIGDPEYHNWLKVGLAIRLTTDGLQSFCERHGRAFNVKLLHTWKQVPLSRVPPEPEWTDADLPAIKCALDTSDAGTEYKSSAASKQRKDFAEAIKRHHVNSVENTAGTGVPANKVANNGNIKYEHCNASRWGDAEGWFEVFKAYIQMRIGSHAECIMKMGPGSLDICGLTAGMNFCDGFSKCVDQRTKALPLAHLFRVAGNAADPSGRLEAARNVRNGTWGHVRSLKLTDDQTVRAITDLLRCLRDDTSKDGTTDTLSHDRVVCALPICACTLSLICVVGASSSGRGRSLAAECQ